MLDFAGDLVDVVSQPARMRFEGQTGWAEHIPDFLAVTRVGTWLIDVRPAGRIGERDRVKFAAAAEAALACGWRYLVVTGWRPCALSAVDTLASQRRPLSDVLEVQDELLGSVARGPLPFGELAGASRYPPVARAHALHLLWHRRLGVDLARPLNDQSLVWAAGGGMR